MKTSLLAPALLLTSLAASPAANLITVFTTGFETDTVGGTPAGFSTNASTGTTVTVTTDQASTGTNSLFMEDGSGSGNPSISKDFGTNYSASTFSFDYRDSSVSPSGVSFRIDFFNTGPGSKNFDIILSGTAQGSIGIRNPGGTTVKSTGNLTSFSPAVWNTISIDVDENANTASIFLNGTKVIDSYSDASIDWNVGKFTLNQGFGSAVDRSGYVDNVSFAVPEPSALLLSAMGALALLRRRR